MMSLALTARAQVPYVVVISVDGLGGTYLSNLLARTDNTYPLPNFKRLRSEGASTLAAHIDNDNWETLPNHTSIVTARPQRGTNGHGWTGNGDPTTTIHRNKGSYVAGVFDVAHDNGLRTGMYANKSKFSLFDTYGSYTGGGSYNAVNGAMDITGEDNGRDKMDNTYISSALGGIIVSNFIAQQKTASPNHYAFVHINEPDSYGHSTGWGSTTWCRQVTNVDLMLGRIFKLIEQDIPAMTGNTAIILTADHGNQDNPRTGADRYAVPFFVWGPGVAAGVDLYALNAGKRQMSSSYPMTTYSGMQPIRNAEANNLALQLLGLGPIPGSTFNSGQDLRVINLAPIADASATPTPVISPNGVNATVILDGSRSSDPDGDLVNYTWYEPANPAALAHGAVAVVSLPVGVHEVALVADDGMLAATNAVTVEVLTTLQAVERLAATVKAGTSRSQPLVVTLEGAVASIDRSDPVSAINQLLAFQNQVRAQLAPLDPVLAEDFLRQAQEIVDVLSGGATNPGGRPHARFTAMAQVPGGRVRLQFSGEAGPVYLVEATTNLMDWEKIGVAVDHGDGTFSFEDAHAARFPNRFYRTVSP
jgi:hypothetical protein